MVKSLKNAVGFVLKNRYLFLVSLAVFFVMTVVSYKLLFSKPTYMYARVKVGQGYWWASTQKPSLWFLTAIQKAGEEKDMTGKTVAKVLSVSYYPYYTSGQYDIYLTLLLRVSKENAADKYNYDRNPIGVGAPIDLQFNNVQFSGTVIDMSSTPLSDTYVEKTVTLTKKNSYPWEYEAITPGDSYFNGITKTLEVLEKDAYDTATMVDDSSGNYNPQINEDRKFTTVKLKLKGKIIRSQFVYGEDQVIIPGRSVSLSTPNFLFSDFTVSKIE